MYKRLEKELEMLGISKRSLAGILDKGEKGYDTLLSKFCGEEDFTLKDAREIKRALHSDASIEELFEDYSNFT